MTKLLYLADSEILSCTATVLKISSDERGPYCVLDRTVAHKKGGGQKGDRGELDGVQFVDVVLVDGEIRHYLAMLPSFAIGGRVEVKCDEVWRSQNSRLHSAGHEIAAVVDAAFPELVAVAGHHYRGEGRVDFNGPLAVDGATFIAQISELLAKAANSDLPIRIVGDPFASRAIQIGDHYPPVPCGGTHVQSTGQLGALIIRGVKVKDGKTRVSYDVGEK